MVGGKLGDNVNCLWDYFVQIEFSLGLELLANQDFFVHHVHKQPSLLLNQITSYLKKIMGNLWQHKTSAKKTHPLKLREYKFTHIDEGHITNKDTCNSGGI